MHLRTLLFTISSVFLVQAQELANLTASLTTYSTSQCCGGSIAYNKIPAGQCVQSSGHPSIFGASITIRGFWGSDVPGGDSNVAYGYLSGFSDSACKEKAYEIKYEGCVSIDEAKRARSWMWTRETYSPPMWRRGVQMFNGTSVAARSSDGGTDWKVPRPSVGSYLSFFDAQAGRERRVSLGGTSLEVEEILKLYENKDYAAIGRIVDSTAP